MPELAFSRDNSSMSSRDLAFIVEAVDKQLREHFCPATGCAYYPAVYYETLPDQHAVDYYPAWFCDDIKAPGALGFHDFAAGFIYIKCVTPSNPLDGTVASHEGLECSWDPECNLYLPMPSGLKIAKEGGDPVEGDSYGIDITLFGETRTIQVSNFVLPAFFDTNSSGPYDYLGKLKTPFTMDDGGYEIIQHQDGSTEEVFADHPIVKAAFMAAHGRPAHPDRVLAMRSRVSDKLQSPYSRLSRRRAAAAQLNMAINP